MSLLSKQIELTSENGNFNLNKVKEGTLIQWTVTHETFITYKITQSYSEGEICSRAETGESWYAPCSTC